MFQHVPIYQRVVHIAGYLCAGCLGCTEESLTDGSLIRFTVLVEAGLQQVYVPMRPSRINVLRIITSSWGTEFNLVSNLVK